jgi:DhnA family fructose-bisphosphate aldolase class Ia
MSEGKQRRLRRIFGEDGCAVIVAMDHGGYFGTQPGLEQPREVMRQVIAGGADAMMTTVGLAQHFGDELAATPLLLRVDGGVSKLGTRAWRGGQIFQAETALRLGADGVVAMGFPGAENENKNLQALAQLSEQCLDWGLPLMAEMLPRGFEGGDDARAPETIAFAMRLGAELGADIIKTQYTGSVESFQKAVSSCYVPVVVLGGPKMEDDVATLRTVREAINAGARGVAMGRNIWNHPNPEKMTAAIVAIVHRNASVDDAIEMLKG